MYEIIIAPIALAGLTLTGVGQYILRHFPAASKAPAAAATPVVEPVLPVPANALEIHSVAALGRGTVLQGGRQFIRDEKTGREYWERPPRHRHADISKEKVIAKFVAWMIAEDYCGWYTPRQIYESYQEFAWEHSLEEVDFHSFLSMLAAEPGVLKRRPYIQKNETYRHLRAALKGQERATVYRIPTAQELAAARHRRDLKAAEIGRGLRVPKTRLTPGGQQPSPRQSRARNGLENNDLGLPISDYEVAA